MADSVSITPGTGDSIAADEIAGVKHQRVKLTIGADGVNDGDVSATNPLPTRGSGVVSTGNSSTATLGGGAAFTGSWEEVTAYALIQVNVFSDQASGTNGLSLQQSSDGVNADFNDTFTISASTGKFYSVQPGARYFRVVYTNGATPQGAFRLQTLFKYTASKGSSQRASDAYTNETDLEQVQSFNMLLNPAGTWDRQRIDAGVSTGAARVVMATDSIGSMNIVGVNTTNTLGVYLASTAGTININLKPGTIAVSLDPGHLLGAVTANAGTGSFTVQFDPGHTLGAITSVASITSSINAYIGATGGTLSVQLKPGAILTSHESTASIFTASGSASSAGNNTIISPSASYNFKIFAYSIQTTGLVSVAARFTTGASAGATELWRPFINSSNTTSAPVGANLAVPGDSYIFATGTATTLALYLDAGTLVHYSVAYRKESA